MWNTLKPWIETAVAAYWAGSWITGLDTYDAVLAWLKTAIPF